MRTGAAGQVRVKRWEAAVVQNLNAKRLQRASSRPGRFPVAPPYLRRAHSSPKTPSVDRNVVQGTHQSGEQTGQICTPGLHLFLGGMWLARRLLFAASFARVGWLDGRLSTTAGCGGGRWARRSEPAALICAAQPKKKKNLLRDPHPPTHVSVSPASRQWSPQENSLPHNPLILDCGVSADPSTRTIGRAAFR